MMKFFEDLKIGDSVTLGSHTFEAGEMKTFARQFDPQRFHVDDAEAEKSHFGKLCASGWHTTALWMRKMVDYRRSEAEAMQARGERVPTYGPSPGFHDLKWFKPVYAGDTISYAAEVIEMRASKTRPQWGLMTLLNSGANQDGERVVEFKSIAFLERRTSTAA